MESTAKGESEVVLTYRGKVNLYPFPWKSFCIDYFYWVFNSAVAGINSTQTHSYTSGTYLTGIQFPFALHVMTMECKL